METKDGRIIDFVKWGVTAALSFMLVGAATYLAITSQEAKDWFIALASMAAGFWLAGKQGG